MKTKPDINDRVLTEYGPGIIVEIDRVWGEYGIKLDAGGRMVYVLEEDLEWE